MYPWASTVQPIVAAPGGGRVSVLTAGAGHRWAGSRDPDLYRRGVWPGPAGRHVIDDAAAGGPWRGFLRDYQHWRVEGFPARRRGGLFDPSWDRSVPASSSAMATSGHGEPGVAGRPTGRQSSDWVPGLSCPFRLYDVAYALEYVAPFRDDEECLRWLGLSRNRLNRRRRLELFARVTDSPQRTVWSTRSIRQQQQTLDRAHSSRPRAGTPGDMLASGALDLGAERIRWSQNHRHLFVTRSTSVRRPVLYIVTGLSVRRKDRPVARTRPASGLSGTPPSTTTSRPVDTT
jgi:hypothetical protein